MNIKHIDVKELKNMSDREGLIIQGCGGSLEEWVTGVNSMLNERGVFLDNLGFEDVYTFENDELTCLLFPFDDVQLDIANLAMWRLQTYQMFAGKWLSDYVDNYLGGFNMSTEGKFKPDCKLIGEDGNIFNLMAIASKTLSECGMRDDAKEMRERITTGAQSYEEALCIIGEYVNITGDEEEDEYMDY